MTSTASDAFIYQLWESGGYAYVKELYDLYTGGVWTQFAAITNQEWFFPTVTILYTATNLILVSF